MPYMVTFTINIPQMLAYIPYMDPMGMLSFRFCWVSTHFRWIRSDLGQHVFGSEVLASTGSSIFLCVGHGRTSYLRTKPSVTFPWRLQIVWHVAHHTLT